MPSRPRLILLLALFLFGFLLPGITAGQEPATKPAARKFDEFGDVNYSDRIARLDNFAIELQNSPTTLGYAIVYRSRRDTPGLNARMLWGIRKYLVYTRRIPGDRIVTIDGGPATNLTQELWIAPPGTTPPIRSDAYTLVVPDRTSVRLFDDYYFDLMDDTGWADDAPRGGDNYPGGSLEAFAAALAEEPKTMAYVIAYPEYRVETERNSMNQVVRKVRQDPPGTAKKMLEGSRRDLTREYGVAASRIKLVNGGYRRQRAVALWLVPPGEHPPIATPDAFPPKRTAKPKKSNHTADRQINPPEISRPILTAETSTNETQQAPTEKAALRKFDEFGDVLLTDIKARLDNFAVELQYHPGDVGYIVVYRSRRDGPGLSARHLDLMRRFLWSTRGIANGRLVMIDGGLAPNLVHEYWIGPAGAKPPTRNDALPLPPFDLTVPLKFDDLPYYEERIGDSIPAFAELVKQNNGSNAYVIVYPGYQVETSNQPDQFGYAFRDTESYVVSVISEIRKRLTGEFQLPHGRVRIVNGGYRKQRSVELWIVPADEHPPIATPNAFPPKRSGTRRKSNHYADQGPGTSAVDQSTAMSLVPASRLQPQSNLQNVPRKFDEFGPIMVSDKKARLDNFTIELQNNPDVTGYIIVYRNRRDLPGLSARLLSFMRNYATATRGIAAARLVAVDGGVAPNLTQELWVVPPGAPPPPVRSDVVELPTREPVWKFDDYDYFVPSDDDDLHYGSYEEGDPLPAYASVLREYLDTTAYVLVYPQYSVERWSGKRRVRKDSPATVTKMMGEIRTELTKNGVAVSRLKLINGGYRKQRSVELWVVPAGEHPPIATPNAFPPKRRASKKNHAHQSRIPSARKFDEFPLLDLAAVRQRLDRFAAELTSRPSDHGFVMFYRGRTDLNGVSARWAEGALDYLRRIKGIDHLRLMGHAPGAIDQAVMELWIGSRDAYPDIRKPVDTGTLPDPRRTRKFDEYYYDLTDDGDTEADARSRAMRLAGDSIPTFAALRSAVPDSLAYVIVYPEYRAATRQLDPPETADRMLGAISAELTEAYNLDPSLMRLMNGGYRKQRTVELWLVPRGKRPPRPTPNAFPRKQKKI
jgi:anti-sigma-K factor RskA